MSSIALKDNKIVYAKDFNINDKNTMFDCPTKNCLAKFQLCAIGSIDVNQYFRKVKGTEHIDYCYLKAYSSEINNAIYDKDTINLNKLLNKILNENYTKDTLINQQNNVKYNNKNILNVNTLKNTYYILKQLSPNSYVGKTLVRDIILDNRTDYYYINGIYKGLKIVEAKILHFNNKIIKISPIFKDNVEMFLKFNCEDIYKSVISNFKRDKDNKITKPLKNNFIVVVGNWHKNTCFIENIGQTFFIKKSKN